MSLYRAHPTGADIGPIVEVQRYRKSRGFVTERWVVNELVTRPSGYWVAFGVRLTANGEADRRQVHPGGGIVTRPIPGAYRSLRLNGEYHRPEVSWGRR